MKNSKILTTLVVIAMVASTMIVINKIADIDFIEEASAADANTFGIGYYEWDGDDRDFVDTNNDELYYGNDLDIQFNETVLTNYGAANYYLFFPDYERVWSGGYKYNITWTQWNEGGYDQLTGDGEAVGCLLDVAGPWFVTSTLNLEKVDLVGRQIYNGAAWIDIVGMFWVNGSEAYTVSVDDPTVLYDKNETLTITITSTVGEDHDVMVDIRKDDSKDPANSPYDAYVVDKQMVSIDDGTGTWALTKAQMYTMTHDYGAGTYNIQVYRNEVGVDFDLDGESTYVYGSLATNTGYNTSFGNQTAHQGWEGWLFRNSTGQTSTVDEATYNHTTCGPYDPPEYFADWDDENITVMPGEPGTMFNSEQELFWNSSYSTTADEINVSLQNYEDEDMDASQFTVALWNTSNNPAKDDSIPISPRHYNVTTYGSDQYLVITPWNDSVNKWGWNSSDNTHWAPKGKVFVTIGLDSVANETEEWNTSFYFKLIIPQAAFRWVNDGSTVSDSSLTDGELEKIPAISAMPLLVEFQVISGDYEYWGNAGSGGATTEEEAAENVTITGDSLFTGVVSSMPNYGAGWFSANTWKIPIIPLMAVGGGEITITAKAFNKTIKGTLSIGGSKYYNNGTVVTVTPNQFNIDEEDKTLDITVQTGAGVDVPGAIVEVFYIDEDAWAETAGIRDGAGEEIDTVTSGATPTYSMEFNTTQQTTNQTEAGLAESHAPRNLTVYVVYGTNKYGYALISMNPNNDLELEIGRETMLAGLPYDDFSYECTIMGTNDTPNEDDKDEFKIRILNEGGNDKTNTLFSDSGYTTANSFTGHYSRDEDDFEDIYALEDGTYTFYAYNKTHSSRDHNATLVVEQVDVTCDKSPFVWKYDENISATFSARYNGVAINGSLVIDNLSNDPGSYNNTYMNTSFDGDSDTGGNGSIEVLEDEMVNGDATIHDITADYLPPDVAEMNITFWFLPIADDGDYGAYARCSGRVPIQVPSVSPIPKYVAVGERTTVNIHVSGRGDPIDDIFVGLSGRGVDVNGTSGSDGKATFSIMPNNAGNISIDVGEEGRTVDTVLIATNWVLDVSAPAQVNEREDFDVTVTEEDSEDPVEGATVEVQGIGTATTDASGVATFTAPEITSDRTLMISATADGYAPDADKNIVVINQPKLYMSLPTEITADEQFIVTAGGDDGNNNGITVTITYNNNEVASGITVNGEVAFKVKEPKEGKYSIKATKADYIDSDTITFKISPGSPGFELLTLIVAIGVAFILLRRRRH